LEQEREWEQGAAGSQGSGAHCDPYDLTIDLTLSGTDEFEGGGFRVESASEFEFAQSPSPRMMMTQQ
jgi:hypothetical protein